MQLKFFRKQLKGRKRWVIMSFSKQQEKKNHKIPNSNGWHACKSWLQLPCFILFDCAVCYAKFYQASIWTGPTWACLSFQTWRDAPLLHVGFPLLVLGLDVFRMRNFSSEISRSFTYEADIKGNLRQQDSGYWYAYSGIYTFRNNSH